MENAVEILTSGTAVLIYEIIALAILVFFLAAKMKKGNAEKERQEIRQAQNRNEQLEKMLENPQKEGKKNNAAPYEVKYRDHYYEDSPISDSGQLEITVSSNTSVKKYMFDLPKEITVGRDAQNLLQIDSRMVSRKQCVIYAEAASINVRNLSTTNPTGIIRGTRKRVLKDESVKMNEKDVLELGDVQMELTLHK